jgi:UDP-GlcNAc:undecaprenyl-phosphate GlcNAc-1-phosphate transferase
MNFNNYCILAFLIFFTSLFLSFVIKKTALKYNIIDQPDKERKLHLKTTPLLGGVAVFVCFFIFIFFKINFLTASNLNLGHWLGFFFGGLILVLGGALDDKYNLNPKQQIIFPIIASIFVIIGGVSIDKIGNPFGGQIILDNFSVNICSCLGSAGTFSIVSALLIFIWLMGMMYTTKILDGLDGLVAGVTAIGALIIAMFTFTSRYYQPDIGLAAFILFFAVLGFLFLNWHPAKIFLGEGGSLFLGFALGVLSIISGAKIAIALLVMGLPILDLAWIIIQRLREGKNPFKHSDRKHLHFRLLDIGLSQKQAVLLYYVVSLVSGLSALFLQSQGKIFALGLLIILMIAFIVLINSIYKKKSDKKI